MSGPHRHPTAADSAPALSRTAQVTAAARDAALPTDPWVTAAVQWRTEVLHRLALAFFNEHPTALGVHLGCGLANPFARLDNGRNRWIDADLPISLRARRALHRPAGVRQRNRRVDLRQPGWWQRLGLPDRTTAPSAPVLVQCEGVLMYLQPDQVRSVLHEFAERAPSGSRWAMDVMSILGVGGTHWLPSLRATGAQFRWGVRHLEELPAIHPRLQLQQVRSMAECWGPTGLAWQAWCLPWTGAPLYSVVCLGV